MMEIFGIIGLFFQFMDILRRKQRENNIKSELYELMEEPFNNISRDLDALLDSAYLYYGALVMSSFLPPQNPQEKAEKIALNIKIHMDKLNLSLKEGVGYIKAHKDSLKEISTESEWILIESVIYSFKDDSVDWNFLIKNKAIQNKILNENQSQEFRKQLSEELDFLKCDLNIEFSNSLNEALSVAIDCLSNCKKFKEQIQKNPVRVI